MSDEQKMLQRMGAMLIRHARPDLTVSNSTVGLWIHAPGCDLGAIRCSCCPVYVLYITDRDGDITVTEVGNSGKLRVRLGERG